MHNFSKKQIVSWKRVRMNIEPDLVKLSKIEGKINQLQAEAETIKHRITLQEAIVKVYTGGFTSQQIFDKQVISTGKVDANGREIKKTDYILRYPDTILPVPELLTIEKTSDEADIDINPTEDKKEESIIDNTNE